VLSLIYGCLFVSLIERWVRSFSRYINEKPVEQSAAVRLDQVAIADGGEREASLTLNSVSLDDSAVVKAVATNAVGKVDALARLNVESE
jgi:hypothetical protein